ncbi:hypothetical protein [Nostoc sp.]|uniref:hypothetical protein n=1 Tax=Nostoc sp. TaxID=1180 RepID=UPI002FF9B409
MARTVNVAFDDFLRNYVNLDPNDTAQARKSRDWLVEEQIHSFPEKDIYFPTLYSEKDIYFGSFARRTKKRELDDIDIMIVLSGEGGYYHEYIDGVIEIYVPDSAYKLKRLCFDGTNKLNSRKVINKIIALLNKVPHYEKADINRNLEAATLKLKSYYWNFDIIPCFFTKPDFSGRTYYLIPDGQGNWKKTDPRIDRDRVTEINQSHDGNILNLIRLMKFWNRRPTMSSMSSYLLENMILDYYSNNLYRKASSYVDLEVPNLLQYIRDNIFNSVNDPKGIQVNINNLKLDERSSIWARAHIDNIKALDARQLESQNNHQLSISKWREVFGTNFPIYS